MRYNTANSYTLSIMVYVSTGIDRDGTAMSIGAARRPCDHAFGVKFRVKLWQRDESWPYEY